MKKSLFILLALLLLIPMMSSAQEPVKVEIYFRLR